MYRECLSCDDILLVPRHSDIESRTKCDPKFYDSDLVNPYDLPIMASPMDRVYSKEMDEFLTSKNIPVVVHRYFKNYKEQLNAAYKPKSSENRFFAIGSIKNREWIDGLLEEGIKHFCVDMAHGDTSLCTDTVKYLTDQGSNIKVIAGNVATRSGFARLQDAGAWMIRCGIGSGSICSTRTQTGFGVPLLTCVEDCASVKDYSLLVADGGMKNAGDLMKAMAFGADLCMMGKMLAATSLAPGDCYSEERHLICAYDELEERIVQRGIHDDNPEFFPKYGDLVRYKEYRGMASAEARGKVLKKASIEGVSGLIPYTGTTEAFINDLELNMKAALSYAGVKGWNKFRTRVKKIRISGSAWRESQTHVI